MQGKSGIDKKDVQFFRHFFDEMQKGELYKNKGGSKNSSFGYRWKNMRVFEIYYLKTRPYPNR